MAAFQPTGAILSFTADAIAPSAVQPKSLTGVKSSQFVLTNTDDTDDVLVGWGPNDANAKIAATGINANCYYLLHGTQVVVSAASDSYFTGIAAAAAIVKIQAGVGE